MRRRLRGIWMGCMSALLLATLVCANVFAAGSGVTYDGNARSFIFTPGSEENPTDLFDDFKDIMPGGTYTQSITVKNDADSGVDIRIYLRSLGGTEDAQELLGWLNLTVEAEDGSVLFDAAPSETADLTDWVALGYLSAGGQVVLNLTLTVDIAMGNDLQNAAAEVTWEFMVEEIESAAKTGDSGVSVWLIVLLIAAVVVIVLLVVLKCTGKKEETQEAVEATEADKEKEQTE